MLEKLIAYIAKKHLLMNFLFIVVIVGGIFAWQHTSKEEYPDVTFDFIRISINYPGAPAEDVELLVTKPVEERLRGLDGIYRITSTSSVGSSSIAVEIERDYPQFEEAISEIRNAVMDAELPVEVIDDPSFRIFKTSKKAIIDIALIHKNERILTLEGRRELQRYAYALENQLMTLSSVNDVRKRGYMQEELQIKVDPEALLKYEIPFNTVMRQIRENNIRKPAGTLEAENEPKVTLLSELNSPEALNDLIIQGGFDGQVIRLGQIADINYGYERAQAIYKVNGHEAVMFNIVKNSSSGILETLEKVRAATRTFERNNLQDAPIELVFLDDESIDVRNRLNIIGINGTIGFIMILAALFIFLNFRAGIWVAMGIPFTFCCTMMIASIMGNTINGITLAGVIIVMGMVVDDAIVVAENITRMRHDGLSDEDAVIKGTAFVLLPIVASIVTTCVAFVPLFFFTGRHSGIIEFIPPIIFLMLLASLFESIFILPGHMSLKLPFLSKSGSGNIRKHWFARIESRYAAFLERILRFHWLAISVFMILLAVSAYIGTTKMKFTMFPHEETRDLVITGETKDPCTRYETARLLEEIEDIVKPQIGKDVVGLRSAISLSRRGNAAEENRFRMIIEIVPKEERERSADEILSELEAQISKIGSFKKVKFAKSRWGQSSGSPIAIIVQQNNNEIRHKVVDTIAEHMRSMESLSNVDADEGLLVPEYRIQLDREMIKRLSISPAGVSSTFRAALEGTVLYEYSNGDEDIRVRLSILDSAKTNINTVLDLPVENTRDYMVSLRNIVTHEEITSPNAISRRDLKRTSMIYADMNEGTKSTPLEVAEHLENTVFNEVLAKYPTTALSFGGEIQDTRESKNDLRNAVIMVIVLIYFILAVLFNSTWKPLIIMLAIPFGLVGIVLAFYLHGKVLFGLYAAIGALGLAGVVVNDAIIMLVKLDKEYDPKTPDELKHRNVAEIASTRLRAVFLTTLTTVAGILPTAYGFAGYDAMLSEMMLALAWGLIFGTFITLMLIPCVFMMTQNLISKIRRVAG